jgi:hypothetical protein
MAGTLGDFRFEGYSNDQLADQVHKLKAGAGAKALQPAIDTLHSIAQDLNATSQLLTTQLGKLGIDWQSAAGQGAQDQTTDTIHFTDGAQYNIQDVTGALTTQSDSHTVARSAPAPSTDNQKNTWDNVTGFFGYQTDHAKEVDQANADRQTAIQQLTNYQSNSQYALNSTQPLGQPPGINLTSQPVRTTGPTTSLASYAGPGYVPTGGVPAGAGPGYVAPSTLPGGGVPGGPITPGISTGVGPGGTLPTSMPAAASAAGSTLAEEVGMGAVLAGGAGAVAAGAKSGTPETMVRGGGSGGPNGERTSPSRASATAGAIDEAQAAQARAAERIAPSTRPAAGGKGRKEEDGEHNRKYMLEEDLFGDQRLVAPTVLGEEPDA